MSYLLKYTTSSVFTCYRLNKKCYDTCIFANRPKYRKVLHKSYREYETFETVLYKKQSVSKRMKTPHRRTKIAELLKITAQHTTQTTMPVGKLKASHVTAFAEEPGMVLRDLSSMTKSHKSVTKSIDTSRKSILSSENDVLQRAVNNKDRTKNQNELLSKIDGRNNENTTYSNIQDASYLSLKQMLNSGHLHLKKHSRKCGNVPSEIVKCIPANSAFFNSNSRTSDLERNIFIKDNLGNFNQEQSPVCAPQTVNEKSETDLDSSAWHDVQHIHFKSTVNNWDEVLYPYVDVCVNSDLLELAYESLKYAILKNKVIHNPDIYNIVIQGFSQKGNIKMVKELMTQMKAAGVRWNCQTYAIFLECLHQHQQNTEKAKEDTYKVLRHLQSAGFQVNDLFTKTQLRSSQKENVLKQIRLVYPHFEITPHTINLNSSCPLVDPMYQKKNFSYKSPSAGVSFGNKRNLIKEQLELEKSFTIPIESVVDLEDASASVRYQKYWENLNEVWRQNLIINFNDHIKVLKAEYDRTSEKKRKPSLYVYLNSVTLEDLITIMMKEINSLTLISNAYSSPFASRCFQLGKKVWYKYSIEKKIGKEKMEEDMKEFFNKYCDWYFEPNGPARNTRQKWQMMLEDSPDASLWCEKMIPWPAEVLHSIGKYLYNIIFKSTVVQSEEKNKETDTPGFFLVLRFRDGKVREEIKCNPSILKLYKKANIRTLLFDVDQLPMLCPPRPWSSVHSGGYLLLHTDIVRFHNGKFNKDIEDLPGQRLYPIFDSLNQLQSVPWTINREVLDTALEVFKTGGSEVLNIPIDPKFFELPQIPSHLPSADRFKATRERLDALKAKHNEYALWCEALYKLSLANHYRNKVFWLPQNMDFRGRVYPVPPHVSHISSDLYRSLFLFARKLPLGSSGLNWLKIHAINLTGTHKRKSVSERLAFANEILPEILYSAENPLNGNKWWTKSENPWQTLAVCIEIYKALKSPYPEKYESGFPVHQDGSCNGLQHYAALGRDKYGAHSVNLVPCDEPQDVYTVVTNMVENSRKWDAENGVKIAQLLNGYVQRKVIKQTIMTTVYGVTYYGAKEQIAGRLRDIKTFPQEKVGEGAAYLATKVFGSLKEVFHSARDIQDWLTTCANNITRYCGNSVSWVTPLGLPVRQPYYLMKKVKNETVRLPNTRKQKNAFAPNFIHSLDSTHMMLTSMYCENSNITFASIHDCFWTHASTVDVMNTICREQFLALHSQNILQHLRKHFLESNKEKSPAKEKDELFSSVPKTGDFELADVLDSTYFFS